MKKINLSKYYEENKEKAEISYKTFTTRAKSGVFKNLEEALLFPKGKLKGIRKERKLKKESITDIYNRIKKDNKLEDKEVISYRSFTDRIKKEEYKNDYLKAILKGDNNRKKIIKKKKERKKKKRIVIRTEGINKREFYDEKIKKIDKPILSYRSFCNNIKGIVYNEKNWEEAILKKSKNTKSELKEYYDKERKKIAGNTDFEIVKFETFRRRISRGYKKEPETLVFIRKERKKKTIKKKRKKDTLYNGLIEKDLNAMNLLESLNEEEIIEKKEELQKVLKERKEVFILYNNINIIQKKGIIKGIFVLVDRTTDYFWEIVSLKGDELFIVEPYWLKKIKR